jgi:glyoxylase-like metal-dependent hydrolase (beta-lactamase superfamily II)
VRVGSVEITPLIDSIGSLGDLSENYPDVPAVAWAPYAELYPEVFVEGRWRLLCGSFLLRFPGHTILVDTGTGPSGSFWESSPELEARLPAALAEHGVAPEEVDVVFVTHTHGDHIGWNTDAAGEPTFPRARYLMDPEAVARAQERSDEPHVERCFGPLFERELVAGVDGGAAIAPGVVTAPLPGHELGHTGLRVSSEGAEALLIGDAVPHPALVDRPEWLFKWDRDPSQSQATRAAVLSELVDTDVLLVCGHYPRGGIGLLRTRDGRVVFEPSD